MKTAIVFPGQGAQALGMGRELYESFSECRDLFDEARLVLGYDLAEVCFNGPEEELTRSDRAQPAIFVVSAAAHAALLSAKPQMEISAVAGLSSGEWCALYAAGVVTCADALRVLEARGRFMQEACQAQSGSMISIIGLERPALESVCAQTGLQIANLNSPEQTVLSGPAEGVEKAEGIAKELGAKRAIRLNVAGAFHSGLMKPAAERFAAFLQEVPFAEPSIPVISNVTGKPHENPESIRQLMVRQITDSVQWVESIAYLQGQGVGRYIECGPGRVLSGLIKRIDKQAALLNIQDPSSLKSTVETL